MEKEFTYMTRFFIGLAVVSIVIMTIGNTALSWSQNHLLNSDYLLYITLSSIMSIFILRSFLHDRRNRMMFWIIRQRHWNRFIAMLFACVMFFGVNHDGIIGTLHLVFTALAILAAYIGMMYYYRTNTIEGWGAVVGSASGIGLFLFSYFMPFLTVAEGEMIAAIPIIIWIYSTTKIK